MTVSAEIARHVRELHFGENPTWLDLKNSLADVTWQQATTRVDALNTIAALVYHIHFFVRVGLKVLEGEPLNARDSAEYSFDVPPIESGEDWERLLAQVWSDAERFASAVEQLPERRLWETFVGEQYGNHYRNLHGVIEHSYYHLGQIVLMKKLLSKRHEDEG